MRGIRKIRRSERKDGAEGEGRGRSRNNEYSKVKLGASDPPHPHSPLADCTI